MRAEDIVPVSTELQELTVLENALAYYTNAVHVTFRLQVGPNLQTVTLNGLWFTGLLEKEIQDKKERLTHMGVEFPTEEVHEEVHEEVQNEVG